MSLTKTFHAAILSFGLLVLQITLERPARADGDAPANPTSPTATTPANAAQPYTPMTQSERVHHWVTSTFSVEAAIRAAAGAAILQAMDTPAEWGQGLEGYARRHDGHRRLSYSRLGSIVATAFIFARMAAAQHQGCTKCRSQPGHGSWHGSRLQYRAGVSV